MKKVLSILIVLATVMLLLTVPTWALTEGDWEFKLLDDQVTITGYIGAGGKVIIPEKIFGCPVTKVDFDYDNYYENNFNKVTSLTFPSTVKKIGALYFTTMYEGDMLEEVFFSEGLESIGAEAFQECNIRTVKFPSTLRRIDEYAFERCANLVSVEFPDYMDNLGTSCFSYCDIREVKIPVVKEFRHYGETFGNNKNLKKAYMADGNKAVPARMFQDCLSLEEVVIPGSVEKIGWMAFSGCASLEDVVLPISLKEIDGYAFKKCVALKEVVVPYGTKNVYERAFSQCASLKSLYMPDSVEWFDSSITADSNNCIIYCAKGSETEKLCRDAEISYMTDSSVNSKITVLYNGTRISFHAYGQNPELLNSRTLVPLRSIFEAMGATVEWDDTTSTAIAKRNGIEVKIQIGANAMYKNGSAVPVDVPAQLMNDRTMVPVRVIAEAFGADVQWNGNGNVVLINE